MPTGYDRSWSDQVNPPTAVDVARKRGLERLLQEAHDLSSAEKVDRDKIVPPQGGSGTATPAEIHAAIVRGDMGGPVMIPRAGEAVPRKVSVAVQVLNLVEVGRELRSAAEKVLLDYLEGK